MRKRLPPLADIGSELQDQFRSGYRQASIAGPDEDPNVAHACYASPPCYMHEIDPAYFGDASESELRVLLRALLTEWAGALQPIEAMCAVVTGGTIAADLRKIRDQTVAHCRKLKCFLDEPLTSPTSSVNLTLDDFIERSDVRHRLINQARLLLPGIVDGAASEILTGMVETFPDTELTILVAATLSHLSS